MNAKEAVEQAADLQRWLRRGPATVTTQEALYRVARMFTLMLLK